jgi:hypothetical protein
MIGDGPSWWYQEHFPLEVFPNAVQLMVQQTADSLCVHPDMLATAMLPIAGALIGNSRWVRCSEDGWHEPPKIWAAVVADPGGKKSPAIGRLTAPLQKIEEQLETLHGHQIEDWKQLPREGRPPAPKPIRFELRDLTTAVVRDRLTTHPRGILLNRDELTGWLESLGRASFGAGGDRQQWLELWNPSATLQVDRKTGDESTVVRKAFVGLLGGIQPEKLRHIVGRDGDDGLLDRFLIVTPPFVEEYWGTPPVEKVVRDAYAEVIEALYNLPMGQMGAQVEPKIVELDVGGKALAEDFFRNHYAQKNNLRRTRSPLAGMWGKCDAYVYRLALVLTELWQVCENEPEVVDEQRMHGAARVVDFFKHQRNAVQTLLESSEYEKPGPAHERRVVDWLEQHAGQATLKLLRWKGPLQKLSVKDAREVLDSLHEQGQIETSRVGKSTIVRIARSEST